MKYPKLNTTELVKQVSKRKQRDSKLVVEIIKKQDLPRVDAVFDPIKLSQVQKYNKQKMLRQSQQETVSQYSTDFSMEEESLSNKKRKFDLVTSPLEQVGAKKSENQLFTIAERLNIIFLNQENDMQIVDIAPILNVNYSSIRTILTAYRKTGRLNKFLTFKSKQSLLTQRRKEKQKMKDFQRQK